MSEADGGGVRGGAIYTTFVWTKIHSMSKNIHGFVKPIRVHSRIEALDVAPSNLPIITLNALVAKCNIGNVVLTWTKLFCER